MWIVIGSFVAVVALCAFILVALWLGTVSAIVIVAMACTVLVLGAIGLVLGVVAMVIERIEHRRELAHGR